MLKRLKKIFTLVDYHLITLSLNQHFQMWTLGINLSLCNACHESGSGHDYLLQERSRAIKYRESPKERREKVLNSMVTGIMLLSWSTAPGISPSLSWRSLWKVSPSFFMIIPVITNFILTLNFLVYVLPKWVLILNFWTQRLLIQYQLCKMFCLTTYKIQEEGIFLTVIEAF